MNIYLLTQDNATGYDTYDSCVVIAKTEEDAKQIQPGYFQDWLSDSWANSADQVTAKLIGKANKSQVVGTVLCASFNAG